MASQAYIRKTEKELMQRFDSMLRQHGIDPIQPRNTVIDTQHNEASKMVSEIRELFKTALFSDLTLGSGDFEFAVHKLILYTQSDVFNKMLGPGFKEATANRITLSDDRAALNALLHHLYKYPYTDAPLSTARIA